MPTPHVILGDQARTSLKEGIDMLAKLASITLGPRAGVVVSSKENSPPESLTESGIMARRIVEVPNRAQNMGVMMLRHALWQMHEQLGDGGATMAALAHSLLEGGARQIASGANPMLLRRGMERALRLVIPALTNQSQPLEGEWLMAGLAHAATGDPEMSEKLSEIYGRLGPEAHIQIEEYIANYTAVHFLEGASWAGTYVTPYFVVQQGTSDIRLNQPYVLITDYKISEPATLVPLLEKIVRERIGPVLILADDVTDGARAMLLANRARGVFDVVAAKLTSVGEHRWECYRDLAAITGAYYFSKDQGDRIEDAEIEQLGRSRIIQVGKDKITVVGTMVDPIHIYYRQQQVRAQLRLAQEEEDRKKIVERLGKLAGGVGILRIGAASETERNVRKERAERFIRFVPNAVEEGVVPGGGAAYLACQSVLDEIVGFDDEEAIGAGLVRKALEAPMTWLIENAKQSAPVIIDEVRRRGPSYAYDVIGEQVVDMWEANIVDATKVLRVALETAVSIATSALTTEGLVLKRRPIYSRTP